MLNETGIFPFFLTKLRFSLLQHCCFPEVPITKKHRGLLLVNISLNSWVLCPSWFAKSFWSQLYHSVIQSNF